MWAVVMVMSLVCFVRGSLVGDEDEQVCYSRYDYDYKLLTKVVNMERDFKELSVSVKGRMDSIAQRLSTIETDMATLGRSVDNVKDAIAQIHVASGVTELEEEMAVEFETQKVKLSNLTTTVNDTSVRFAEHLREIEQEFEAQKTRFENFTDSVNLTVTSLIVNGMEATKAEVIGEVLLQLQEFANDTTERLEEAKSEISNEFDSQLSDFQNGTKSTLSGILAKVNIEHVLLFVRNTGNTGLAVGDKIVYNVTMTDTGSGYNAGTGIYTIPVTGTYLFNVHITSYWSSDAEIGVTIVGGGEILAYGFNRFSENPNITPTVTGIGKLQQGDQVWVECISVRPSSGYILHVDSLDYGDINSLQGVLVHV